MKKLTAICFALLMGGLAQAQQSAPFEGTWGCYNQFSEDGVKSVRCSADCGEGSTLAWTILPSKGVDCPHDSRVYCRNTLPKPTCYPPGTEPQDSGDDETASSSGGGDNLHRDQKALIAGGAATLAAFFWRHYGPEWVGGLSIRPTTHVAYRDGFAMAHAGLTAEWREWRLTAGSSHDGTGWGRPRGRLDWRWSWEF